ncbi:MAG: cell envelope integrity protein CreD [Asticcacaulis sp.]|uniref:cell envelope integrity protein CreD n=1 Tax=Asticcacaulis sp. TaxID=1872648 RepID=UPI003F7B7FCE
MSNTATPYKPQLISRSRGAKLLIVCFLAVLMSVPAGFVFLLLHDRSHRAEQVADEIGGLMGGPQTFMGPVISVPYTAPVHASDTTTPQVQTGNLIIFPATGDAQVTSKSEVRSRSLFRVPVYDAHLAFTARFDLSQVVSPVPNATLDWGHARLMTGASDSRGARSDIVAHVAGQALTLAPDAAGANMDNGDTFDLFSVPLDRLDLSQPLDVDLSMDFTGAQSLAVLAFAKSTTASLSGDWNWPSFGGGFLPATRAFHHDQTQPLVAGEQDLKSGFKATWSVPFIARGLPPVITQTALSSLDKSALSVSFVEPTNPYQNVGRSLKYALLFVGLVFLTFFLFESMTKTELHPAQYILIGLAQITFYLLLLSLAERIGFDAAFAAAAVATVGLISAYAGMVFKSLLRGVAALIVFGLLYGLIYILMRMEDYALLVGAVSAFLTIAAVMMLTRNLNWYGDRDSKTG